ncbi:MAG: threonine--tRNA ligase, partial [Candidatus Nomurabacteria bacterium]|nr:threonine--tRNA ligase [Candidatus Nomurabacteria bacterium]
SWKEFSHKKVSADEAREIYSNNLYKTELINEIESKGEEITLYTVGDFTDLCRGGHVDFPANDIDPRSFELSHVAGAYWRGDEKNPMLTRIYGLAFESPEKLAEYKEMLAEAKKRDHRKIGKELDLFTFSDLVGAGLPLFTPRGTLLRELIVQKIHDIQKQFGYQRVTIPHITKKELYETSGHWEKFGDELFHVHGKSDAEFVMKPMNCPHHTQIYASQARSYRDLPIRYTESTMVYRDEQAGELLGLGRVRSITQDDGHVFCTPDQIESEIGNIVHVIREFYTSLDMWDDKTYWVSLSVRDPATPEKYLGDTDVWDRAEKTLEDVAKKFDLNYKRVEGEAAFYGPKLDFMFHDAIGRERQLATAQLDFNMPKRFELEYTDSDSTKQTPVMIHRAIAGSLERFLSIIIEHFAGNFPVWMSPVQVIVVPVNPEAHGKYSTHVYEQLEKAGIRAEHSDENESLGKRIRKAKQFKTPYIVVVGDKESDDNTLTIEMRGDEKLEGVTVQNLIDRINGEN